MKLIRRWLPALLVGAFIFVMSSLSGDIVNDAGLGNESLHIGGHWLMFFFLCIALFKATKNIAYSVVISVIYAFLDEFHQKFVPGRSSGLFDIMVDSIGILLAGVILWKLFHILPKKLKTWLLN